MTGRLRQTSCSELCTLTLESYCAAPPVSTKLQGEADFNHWSLSNSFTSQLIITPPEYGDSQGVRVSSLSNIPLVIPFSGISTVPAIAIHLHVLCPTVASLDF